jgi:hypothetical protein
MNKLMVVLALAATMAFASFASAKDKAAAKGPHGKVSKIEKDSADAKITNITLAAGHKADAKEVVVKADEKTTVTKEDGSAGTLADVTAGVMVNVTLSEDGSKATAIAIHAAKKKAAK